MRITVVGDTLLDQDLDGTSTRHSPDAPVPVIDAETSSFRAGGAGLVAAMLANDGHEVTLVTVLSDDEAATRLRQHLGGVRVVAGASGAPTPVKTRIRANGQPVCRLDRGCEEPPVPEATDAMIEAVAEAEAILVADYGRKLLQQPRLRAALDDRRPDVPLVWDPHVGGATPTASADLVTPNLPEAAAAAGVEPQPENAARAAALLRDLWGCAAVVVTLGDAGACLHDGAAASDDIRARKVVTSDPCGAGDRFAATAVTALASGADSLEACRQAVDAASAYLDDGGVVTLANRHRPRPLRVAEHRPADEARPVAEGDAFDRATARSFIDDIRARGGTVVATGGCFDLLHAGHVRTLEAARALGDGLIVCLNSDASVRRLKGSQRPIIRQDDRVELLSALECVDGVLVFDEDSPEALLDELRPDVWVKGGDYRVESLPETRLLRNWGGRVVSVPYHLGRSTTRLAAQLSKVS